MNDLVESTDKIFERIKNRFWFRRIIGEVANSSTRIESHISSSGGAVSTRRGLGGTPITTSTSVNISTQIVTVQEFWIQSDDGQETQVTLRNWDFAVRDGQKVAAIFSGVGKWSAIIEVHNFNTKESKLLPLDGAKIQAATGASTDSWLLGAALLAGIVGFIGMINLFDGMVVFYSFILICVAIWIVGICEKFYNSYIANKCKKAWDELYQAEVNRLVSFIKE